MDKAENTPQPDGQSTKPNLLRRWWKAANLPLHINEERTIFQQVVRRILLWLPVVLPVVCVVTVAAVYFLIGWRARSLAAEAMASVRAEGWAKARMQVQSAANLRPNDPAVRRARLFVQSSMIDPAALPLWEELRAGTTFTAEEAEAIARVATWYGTDAHYEQATEALAQAGEPSKAAAMRSARLLRRGNVTKSIEEARVAVAASDDPEMKLYLARLLAARHGPMLANAVGVPPEDAKNIEELYTLVDDLVGTPEANQAYALVLPLPRVPQDKAQKWAAAALSDLSPTNPALVPAAEVMIRTGESTMSDLLGQLSPVFAKAATPEQAVFAQWLNLQGYWEDSLSLITAEKAIENDQAFLARADALASLQRWDALYSMTATESKAPESLRLGVRAVAARKLGRNDVAPQLLSDSIRAAAGEGRLVQALSTAGRAGERDLADDLLIEICADPATAEKSFRVARDRFGRRGQFESMALAYEAAAQASPQAPAIQDYARRLALLEGKAPEPDKTAAALEAAPDDLSTRLTHSLALLKGGKSREALALFDEVDVFVSQLPPGDQAIVFAIMSANGQELDAAAVRHAIDPAMLEPGERTLLAQ
jgi:tetratricopeptide (TPR) repeat protein